MQDGSKHDPDIDVWAEHLIVLDVVGIPGGRTRAQIYQTLRDIQPGLNAAIDRLAAVGVVELDEQGVAQTAALERLDRPDMICL